MKYIPNAVSVRFARQLLIVKKNSPAIMFGAGITGAVVSTVVACKATLKVEEVLNKHDEDSKMLQKTHNERPTEYPLSDYNSDSRLLKVHLARDLTKLYAPAVGLGIVSIGLLTGAHVTLTRRNVALAAAYAGLDRVFKDYRDRVVKELGVEKDREFRYGVTETEILEETEHGHEVKTVKRVGLDGKHSQYAVLFDQHNPNWDPRAEYRQTFLMLQQTYANQRLHAKGHLLLNDVYDALGMDRTPAGCVVGWVLGGNGKTTAGDGYVDFGIFDPKTQEVMDFMRGEEGAIWLDFNVDGEVFRLIS